LQLDRAPRVLPDELKITIKFKMNSLDAEPMMSLDKFIEQTGLSAVTVWRYRKKGMLTTVNICGRQYILRAEIARFNQRAAAGEFAKSPNPPRQGLLRVDNTACESK
jgi:hypothetical protein